MKKPVIFLALAVIVAAGGAYGYSYLQNKYKITVPAYLAPGELVLVNQGWTDAQRIRFHYTPQGTRLVPYAWFMALEQPCFSLLGCEPFADKNYLSRFGFLAGQTDPDLNPDGLPIGFARQKDFYDPVNKATYPVVGLTCAACHTGQLDYKNYAIRIEGAPAMIEVAEFQKALGTAMGFTQKIPFRYGRFEKRVLGSNPTDEQKNQLKTAFDALLKAGLEEKEFTDDHKICGNPAGFSRTDALTRIGNQVFAVDMKNDANFVVANAPVRFPQLWDASWFTWVQYNSSISDPLVRNIGEALGVRAALKLYGDNAAEFETSVNMPGLKTLEGLLAGPAPFQGLNAPKWPSVLPALEAGKVTKGADLYKQHCQGCHLPPVPELLADLKSKVPKFWWLNSQKTPLLKVHDIPADQVGTDPHEAMDFIARTADTGALNKGRVSATDGLDLVTKGIRAKYFERAGIAPKQQFEWIGFRDPADVAVRAVPVYKARPLNGIWAVAPFLHNGSVPNLYELLSPQNERSPKFWLGNKRYDPVKVGFETQEIAGGFEADNSRAGSSNAGHEFKNGPVGKGVVGPALSPDDRWALIEYLKSL